MIVVLHNMSVHLIYMYKALNCCLFTHSIIINAKSKIERVLPELFWHNLPQTWYSIIKPFILFVGSQISILTT